MLELNETNFIAEVIERSHQLPVLVDFWADWCAPCKILMPILETLAGAYQGRLQIAKVNTDDQRALTQANGIRSLPTLRLYRDGKMVREVLGAQPESALRALLEPYLGHATDSCLQEAKTLAAAGETAAAIQLLEQGLHAESDNPGLSPLLARLYLQEGRLDHAAALIERLPREQRESVAGKGLQSLLDFARIAASSPPPEVLAAALDKNPANAEQRYQLAARQALDADYDAALESFLELLRRHRQFQYGAAQRGLLALFSLLGDGDERVGLYRRRMASLLM
jgi:putative thioredoxin